ncbi:unnamed protein product [Brugia timori]|uniref:SEA domain-containing protein n=1 Tax=Brugia timori TaxID=42155 RepID=A0A0R3Q554_9BILA|nr:unnamed protein product [Brugia timori]
MYSELNLEELISSGPFERNWRGIIIALLVIAAMCSLIIATALLITPCELSPSYLQLTLCLRNEVPQALRTSEIARVTTLSGTIKGTPLTLTDILYNTLLSPIETIEWMDDNQIVLRAINSIRIVNTSSLPITSYLYTKDDILVGNMVLEIGDL